MQYNFKTGLLFLSLTFVSCTKRLDTLPYSSVQIPKNGDVESLSPGGNGVIHASGGTSDDGWTAISYDNGSVWTVTRDAFLTTINDIYFRDSLHGYIVDADVLVFRSQDGGITWNQFYDTSWPLNVNRVLRDIHFINDSTGFACGGRNYSNGLVFKTTNAGETWEWQEFLHEFRSVLCAGDKVIMRGYGASLISNDLGTTWELTGGSGKYFTGGTVNKNGKMYSVTLYGETTVSTDNGITWSKIRDGISGSFSAERVFCIAVSENGRIVTGGLNGYLSYSPDDGKSWQDYRMFDEHDINDLLIDNNGNLIAAGSDGLIFKAKLP